MAFTLMMSLIFSQQQDLSVQSNHRLLVDGKLSRKWFSSCLCPHLSVASCRSIPSVSYCLVPVVVRCLSIRPPPPGLYEGSLPFPSVAVIQHLKPRKCTAVFLLLRIHLG